ncbi:MAG: hypothetical protein LBM93_09555 [Oscillospiraceae bacterium]|jgi:hypothetical protein|nr:hypothetical protein [Oscillospiraceae bacterium]
MEVSQKFKLIAAEEQAKFRAEILKCHNSNAARAVIDNFGDGTNEEKIVFLLHLFDVKMELLSKEAREAADEGYELLLEWLTSRETKGFLRDGLKGLVFYM